MIIMRPQHEVEERSQAIRNDFLRCYDRDQIREQLYREQEGVCPICGKLMRDSSSILCEIDHAISVHMIANWDWDIEFACEVANARRNLLVVHAPCNTAKKDADYEEFIESIRRGEVVLGETPKLTAEDAAVRKERAARGGRIGGRKNVESGHLTRISSLGGRVGGRISAAKAKENKTGIFSPNFDRKKNGLAAVESGQLAWMNTLPQTKEAQRRNGHNQGRINVESGHLDRIRNLPQSKEAQRRSSRVNGIIAGRKAVESGQLALIRELPQTKEGKARYNHVRWHVNRNLTNPACSLCREGIDAKR